MDSKKDEIIDFISKTEKIVVLYFSTGWCGPCKPIKAFLPELEEEYKDSVQFFKINVEENVETGKFFEIMTVPQLHFFKKGERVQKIKGAVSKNDIKKTIDNLLQ